MPPSQPTKPVRIVAIGGSTRPGSTTEMALRCAARAAEDDGAEVTYFVGRDLLLPIYDVQTNERAPGAQALIDAVRTADGLLIASPGYHGGISGMVKNALDYVEDLAREDPAYLHGRAVGCISVAHGWQATVGTLAQIRQTVHALRGWPTPLGGTVNSQVTRFDDNAIPNDPAVGEQLATIGHQVLEFARMREGTPPVNALE
ncbi:MAG TPA: NADPH-dependent FMN reductase [Candidatus Nanopelagicales bacterium]|nr:NADPH-dependent FMN reductase [Candidatus Nanopelagicales bacterium]